MKLRTLILAACVAAAAAACGTPKSPAQKWYESGSWRNGFTANGFEKTDVEQFYDQYNKNQAMYDSIFTWLSEINPTELPAQSRIKEWSHAYANTQDLELRPTDECRIEAHRKYIDLQWVVTGSERFGLVRDTTVLTPINKYRPDVQNFTCNTEFERFDSDPGTFYLFFPSDYHQACEIATEPMTVRKVVVKIEYCE